MISIISPDKFDKFLKITHSEKGLDVPRHIFETSGRTLFEGDIPNNAIITVTDGSLEIKGNVGDNVQITMTNSPKIKGGFWSGLFNKTSAPPKHHGLYVHGTTGNYLNLNADNLGMATFADKVGHGVTISGNASLSRIHMGDVEDHLTIRHIKTFNAFKVGNYAHITQSSHVNICDLGDQARIFSSYIAIACAGSNAYVIYDGDPTYKDVNPNDLPNDLDPMICIGRHNFNSTFFAPKMIISDRVCFGQVDTDGRKTHPFEVIHGVTEDGRRVVLRTPAKGKLTGIDGGLSPNCPVYG